MEGKRAKRFTLIGLENRIGILSQILNAIAAQRINIRAVDVEPGRVSLEVDWDTGRSWAGFCAELRHHVDEFQDISEIDMMPHQRREKELETIINNIHEAVLATDRVGNVTYFNSRARQLFGLHSDLGQNMRTLLPKDIVEDALKGTLHDGDPTELTIRNPRRPMRGIASMCRITNNEGNQVGLLIIVRELEQVRQLIQSTTGHAMLDFGDIVGHSLPLLNAVRVAKAVAPTDLSVMLRGESGTGKELFARAIHAASTRSKGPFVAVNCAAIPDSLLESEFFGYERGAFTGATLTGKQGLFEQATHGTLFLDEIGDLSPHLQAKIVRVIEEQKVRRLGGEQEISTNVRIISATNQPLERMVVEGRFRSDLFYRLCGISILIPPLRERRGDVPLLVRHFLTTIGDRMGKPGMTVTPRALDKMTRHDWPGNVRELRNVMQRAIVLADRQIDDHHIILEGSASPAAGLAPSQVVLPVDLPELIKDIERRYLREAYHAFRSSRRMARSLGLSHTAVINKMRRLGIGPNGEAAGPEESRVPPGVVKD